MIGVYIYIIYKKININITIFLLSSASDIKCCLQAIVYLSWFELKYKRPDKIFLKGNDGNGILVNIKTKDGRASLFWSVCKNGNDFLEREKTPLVLEDVQVAESWRKVTQVLLLCLTDHKDEGKLEDGIPIFNLIPLAGVRRELTGENVLEKFICQIKQSQRTSEHVQYRCPYSQETSMDVVIRSNPNSYTDLLKLDELGAKPNMRRGQFAMIMQNVKSKGIPFHIQSVQDVPILDSHRRKEIIEEELTLMRNNELEFKARVEEAFVPKWKTGTSNHIEAKITENIFVWVCNAIANSTDYSPDLCSCLKVSLSGSTAEGCRLKTMKHDVDHATVTRETKEFEIDLVLETHIAIRSNSCKSTKVFKVCGSVSN